MKLECSLDRLKGALIKVGRVPTKNSAVPVLSCIVLKTEANNLVLKATNLEIGIEWSIPVKTHSEGAVAVNSALLVQFISSISTETNLTLTAENNTLVIETNKSRTVLNTLAIDDFPNIPRLESGKEIEIDPKKLIYGIKSVFYAASTLAIRPELSSIFLHQQENYLTFVATDSFRLAEKKINVEKNNDNLALLIPHKNITEISALLADLEEVVMMIDSNQVVFYNQNIYLFSRLTEGKYPEYQRIIPSNFVSKVEIVKQDLVESIKSLNIFVDDFQQIRFTFEKNANQLDISSKNNEKGENTVNLTVKVEGDGLSLGFNSRYLLDGISSIESEILEFYFAGSNKALVIKGKNDVSFQYLVMPMNK